MVYVLSKDNKPLMPCENVVARLLLKSGKAKVKRKCPFIIKLNIDSTTYTQDVTVGIDTGSAHIGSAAVDSKGNILYIADTEIRNDIHKKMEQRKKYRRTRRNRQTRYRKARFLNRKNSIKRDRLSPTMVSKLQSHYKEIEFIKSILPVTKIVVKTGTFDTHLMKNPALANSIYKHWGYQKGANYGFANTKAKVLNRDNYTCKCCNGKRKDSKLEVHHIIYKSNGGSDDEDNLITLCHTCHYNIHHEKAKLDDNVVGKLKGTLLHATQMNVIRSQLLKQYPDSIETFGFVTKENRFLLGINDKEHYLDACVIATGGKPFFLKQEYLYYKKCIPKGDYQQTKGIRSEQHLNTSKIMGFRKFDKVSYFGREYFIKGRMSSGYAILMDIHGTKVDFSTNPKGYKIPKLSNLKRISARRNQLIESFAV